MENENDIEIIIGDNSNLKFSDVEDCVNTLRPKDKKTNKNSFIIPKNKKDKIEKKED